ncbi:hypothetical protein QFZ77_004794 [Paenibacillus sp. V4I3]|uniref:hypothetical protein n=1 Tax=Paenibacillus sp. V4I3 TaxID=3042305 RepID=UPI00278506F8|nr:hypothetical protein [Paenibacillus sp. V4I3]MDQ0876135.1 hypothetical protein [Paenibacillus sp. V4I3]
MTENKMENTKKIEKKIRKKFIEEQIDKNSIMGWVNQFDVSKDMFDECTKSYVKGLYIASVLLAHAFIEQSISACLVEEILEYEKEKKKKDTNYSATFAEKINIAKKKDFLTKDEAKEIINIYRKVRNPYAHHSSTATEDLSNEQVRKEKAEISIRILCKLADKWHVLVRVGKLKTPN